MRRVVFAALLLLACAQVGLGARLTRASLAAAAAAHTTSQIDAVREARDAVRDLLRQKLSHMAETISETAQRQSETESMDFLSSMRDLDNSLADAQVELHQRQQTAQDHAMEAGIAVPSNTMRFEEKRATPYPNDLLEDLNVDGRVSLDAQAPIAPLAPAALPAAPQQLHRDEPQPQQPPQQQQPQQAGTVPPAPAPSTPPPSTLTADGLNKKPAALEGHKLTDTDEQRAQAASGVMTLKANVLMRTDKETTTFLGRPGSSGIPCPCIGMLNCACGQNIKLVDKETLTASTPQPPTPDPNAKPIEVIRTDVYGAPKCPGKEDSCNKTVIDVTEPKNMNGTVVYVDKKEETLPNNLVRAFIRRAKPISSNPSKLIKPESYVTPLYEAPQVPVAPPPPPPVAPPPPPPPKM